jgi:hypothetical protein
MSSPQAIALAANTLRHVEQANPEDIISTEQNNVNIKQLISNLSHHRLINLKDNIKSVVGPELDKTINTTKGKIHNYKGEMPSEVAVTKDKDGMVLIDKVLRDLLFFDKDLYMKTIVK